jgi:carboxyl-terminal processing protease
VETVNEPQQSQRGNFRPVHALAILLLVVLLFAGGVWVGGHPRQSGIDRLPSGIRDGFVDEQRTALATEVLSILKSGYYKAIDPKLENRLENASVTTLVQGLGDPYTQYLDPDQYKRFIDDRAGKYVGVGVEWQPDKDTARIVRVFPEGPAAKAGVRPADQVVAVDGKAVTHTDGYAAMGTVKGAEGTDVTLRIARTGAGQRDYRITRAEIRRPVVDSRIVASAGKRIGYVHLDQFTDGSAKAFKTAVQRLVDAKVDGIVFDLRQDGGGLVDEAVGIASEFLPQGATIATTRSKDGPGETLKARSGQIDPKIPLAVLVDRGSASASEIVSGALRDSGRARLVGTRTFGKALIQTTRTLPNGGAIKFTVASYLTPKGFDLGKRGLPPDVQAADNPRTPKDEALAAAIAEVSGR